MNSWATGTPSFAAENVTARTARPCSKYAGTTFRFGPNFDGYFFPKSPAEIYATNVPARRGGRQSQGVVRDRAGKDRAAQRNRGSAAEFCQAHSAAVRACGFEGTCAGTHPLVRGA